MLSICFHVNSNLSALGELQERFFAVVNENPIKWYKLDQILAELKEVPGLNRDVLASLEAFQTLLDSQSTDIFSDFTSIDYQADLTKLLELSGELGNNFNLLNGTIEDLENQIKIHEQREQTHPLEINRLKETINQCFALKPSY